MIRTVLALTAILALQSAAAAQPPQEESPAPAPASVPAPPQAADLSAGLATVARILPAGSSGELPATFGVVLGDPPRIVARMSALQGADRATAAFRDGRTVTIGRAVAYDPTQDIVVLETGDSLPLPPEPALSIRWRMNARVFVVPGPDGGEEVSEQTVTESLELGKLRIVPLTGEMPAGLPVIDVQGKWIGITGLIDDATGRFSYLTSSEQIIPIIFAQGPEGALNELPAPAAWREANSFDGLLVRAVLRAFKSPEEALPFFDLAMKRDTTSADLHYWIGKNQFRTHKFADAEMSFRKAFRLRPDWPMAYHMAGAAANQQGEYARAVELYDAGLAVKPDNALTLTNKSGALYNLGRTQDAITVLEEALRIDPNHGMALHNLGVIYVTLGRFAEAEGVYARLTRADSYLAKALRARIDSGE